MNRYFILIRLTHPLAPPECQCAPLLPLATKDDSGHLAHLFFLQGPFLGVFLVSHMILHSNRIILLVRDSRFVIVLLSASCGAAFRKRTGA